MLTAQMIQQGVRTEVESRIKVYPCNNLRASNIGHPCERYLYLLIKHWDEQEPHDYGLQNIFDLGNSIEAHSSVATPQLPTYGRWPACSPRSPRISCSGR